MKKIFNFIAVACVIAAAASCEKPEPSFGPSIPVAEGLRAVTFTATFDNESTKAGLTSDLKTYWEENDTIAVYDGYEIRKFGISSIDGGVATFSGEVADTAKTFKAVYPFTALASATDSTINVTFPSTQYVTVAVPADRKALLAYAVTNDVKSTLRFKNLASLAKVVVSGEGVTKVTVAANANEIGAASIVGATTYQLADSTVVKTVCGGGSSVSLVPASGETLKAGTYYATVAPVAVAEGITAIVGGANGVSVLQTASAVNFPRNGGANLGDVAANAKAVQVSNKLGSAQDIVNFNKYCNYFPAGAVVELTADIDLSEAGNFVPEKTIRFYGSIEGNNHRIYNYTIAGKSGDASVFPRLGYNNAEDSTFVRNIAFGSKDYNFETGEGTYDGVSTCTFDIKDDGSTYYYPGCISYVYGYTKVENLVNYTPVSIPSTCASRHRAGALLGTVKNNVVIKNCKNYGDITNNSSTLAANKAATTGGIVGAFDGVNVTMEDCKNYGTVSIGGNDTQDAGGLIGYAQYAHKVKNSSNYGKVVITATNTKACRYGGVVSYSSNKLSSGNDTEPSPYDNCHNYGDISVSGTAAIDVFIGGIGSRSYSVAFNECSNEGNITVNVKNSAKSLYVGGITSNILPAVNTVVPTITDCDNLGKITVTSTASKCYYVGGITSYSATTQNVISDCANYGSIVAKNCTPTNNGYLAGIAAFSSSGGIQVLKCNNVGEISVEGDVTKNTYFGGIVGQEANAAGLISECTNNGTIKAGSKEQATVAAIMTVGGIAGTTLGTVKDSNNFGTIEFKPNEEKPCRLFCGGVIAANTIPTEVSGCTNQGKIEVGQVSFSAYSYLGGVSGTMNPKVFSNNRSLGEIVSAATTTKDVSAQFYVGGLVGVAMATSTPSATVSGNKVNCAMTIGENTVAWAGMVLGRNAYATAWSLGSESDPVKVAGTFNGTTVTADNLMAYGSGNAADAAGAVCTVYAALGE